MQNDQTTWPKTGAILWTGNMSPNTSLEESEVYHFACRLLCENSPRSQTLLKANTHPDLFILKPIEDSRWIKVDQIRELIDWSFNKAQIACRKIAIIFPADAMNLQAANALLKTLEESSEDSLFILMTARPQALPATIISRCHIIRTREYIPQPEEQQDPLYQQVWRDLKALQSDETDPVGVAALWVKQDLKQILYWLMVILNNAIRKAAIDGRLHNMQDAFDFLDAVVQAKRALQDSPSVNNQLLIESLLIHYVFSSELSCGSLGNIGEIK